VIAFAEVVKTHFWVRFDFWLVN